MGLRRTNEQSGKYHDRAVAKPNVGALMKWFLVSEGILLLFALGGPGSRRVAHDGNWLGQLLFEDPTWLGSVLAYFVLYNVLVLLLFLAAHVAVRYRAANRK